MIPAVLVFLEKNMWRRKAGLIGNGKEKSTAENRIHRERMAVVLTDTCLFLKMDEAIRTGGPVRTEEQIWERA